jgi:peptide/nickel transport system substrate-binding protein
VSLALAVIFAIGSGLVSGAGAATASVAKPKHGGTVTNLLNAVPWNNLRPSTDLDSGEDSTILSAIYGQLFELGPKGAVIPSEATSYKYSNHGLTLDIYLRHGIKFSDGTPFNAQAVASGIQSDVAPGSICPCLASFALVKSVTAVGSYDVQIQLSALDTALIPAFIDEAPNWTPSPSALAAAGATQFAISPVGAGPFEVTSDEPEVKVTTVRNPHYFVKGEPYLDGINFVVTSSDQSDVDAIQAGQAQMTLVTTTTTFQQAKGLPGITTYKFPATAPEFVRLNTLVPPFNNLLAREAVTYATDTKTLVKELYGNLFTPLQGFIAPGMLLYTKNVPNYVGYNLAKAKKIVSEIPGGLTVQLQTTSNTQAYITETGALAQMWQAAGINVTVAIETNPYTISEREDKVGWQAMDGGFLCGVDPSSCMPFNVSSAGLFSAIKDPKIDGLLNQAVSYVNPATRQRTYLQLDSYMNKQADMIWLYGRNVLMVTSSALQGINPNIAVPVGFEDWETAWLK